MATIHKPSILQFGIIQFHGITYPACRELDPKSQWADIMIDATANIALTKYNNSAFYPMSDYEFFKWFPVTAFTPYLANDGYGYYLKVTTSPL